MKNEKWLNVPNVLTSIRILLVPVILITFFCSRGEGHKWTLLLFLVAGLTDCLDGFLARRLHQITKLGKVLDPIADKLMMVALLVCLLYMRLIHWIAPAILAAKELAMSVGAAACLKRDIEVTADIYGKTATLIFYPACVLAWPWHGIDGLSIAGSVLLYCSVALSTVASAHYALQSFRIWKRRRSEAASEKAEGEAR